MAVVKMDYYRNGTFVSSSDTDESRVISTHIRNMKNRGWDMQDISRGWDEFPGCEIIMQKDDQRVNLCFTMQPNYDDGYDDPNS
jgi:hypothetical protein